MLPLETNLDKIKELGEKRENQNYKFISFLKMQDDDEIDITVHKIYIRIKKLIDCTECGNCCVCLPSSLSEQEINTLAAIDKISREEYIKKFTEKNESDNNLIFKDLPCKYLSGKKCTIYEDRPKDCRSYPNLNKHYFTSRLYSVMDNYSICPIVFNVVENLKNKIWSRY